MKASNYKPGRGGEPILGEPCFVNGKFCKVFTEYHWREWLQHKMDGTPNTIKKAILIK